MTITEGDLADFNQYSDTAEQMVSLENYFVKTQTYWDFRDRVFKVLAARQARLKAGKHELKGAALIGPAGAGKSRIVKEIIQEYHALTEVCGRQEFGAQYRQRDRSWACIRERYAERDPPSPWLPSKI